MAWTGRRGRMKNSLNDKKLEWINCPKCGWHSAVLNKQTGLITCQYCMYRSDKKQRKRGRMKTELEEHFFRVFGVEPEKLCFNGDCAAKDEIGYDEKICDDRCVYIERKYPEITDRKLLQLLCIYNDMQGCVEYCLTPCKYEDVKEMILSTLVNEKLAMIDCEKDTYMDVMTNQIQQLFKEGE